MEWYWDAFWVLSESRGVGFSTLNPIGVPSMVAYLDMIEVRDTDARLRFVKLLSRMDSKYRELLAEKKPKVEVKKPK